MTLTETSKALLKTLAKDAPDWNGVPLLEITKEERGILTQLKRAGLLTTEVDEENRNCAWVLNRNCAWVFFTPAGREYVKTAWGIDLAEVR